MHLDAEPLIGPRQVQVLLLHQGEIRRLAVEDEERRILLVELLHLGLGRPHHRDFAQPPDALGAPALPPDQLELVEIAHRGVIFVVLRHLALLVEGELGERGVFPPFGATAFLRHPSLIHAEAWESAGVVCRRRSHALA